VDRDLGSGHAKDAVANESTKPSRHPPIRVQSWRRPACPSQCLPRDHLAHADRAPQPEAGRSRTEIDGTRAAATGWPTDQRSPIVWLRATPTSKEHRVDWDGIGSVALFLGWGAIGVAIVALRAYKAKLASKLDWERLRLSNIQRDADPLLAEQIQDLEMHVLRLTERVDFTERLLTEGKTDPVESETAI